MTTLTVTSRGQVTLRAARPKGKLSNFVGILKGKSSKVATLEELTEAAAECWAGER